MNDRSEETQTLPVRQRILGAALEIMGASGIRSLSQAKVARAAGVRQSHVTYYFPKRADLIAGLLDGHIEQADGALEAIAQGGPPKNISRALETMVSDRTRIRFFLRLVSECEAEPGLRQRVDRHMEQISILAAHYFGRAVGDEDVELFLNTLRGTGLRNLVADHPLSVDISLIAERFGLLTKV